MCARRLLTPWILALMLLPCARAADRNRIIIATDHNSVLRSLGKDAGLLPKTDYALLGGHGLDRNIVIRQALSTGAQYAYVLNPAWWPVKVSIALDCPDRVLVVDGVETDKTISLDLAPHQVAILRIAPPATFLSAQVEVPEDVVAEITRELTDLTLALPHLPTHRPNLVMKNAGFEKYDSRKAPLNWHIFDWHKQDSVFGFDIGNKTEGKQSFFMDSTEHGKTLGIVTDKFRIHPGRPCELAVDLATSAEEGKARIGFTGVKHLRKTVKPDNVWREFTLPLSGAQTETLTQKGTVRVEIHNDAKGILWVDNVRVADTALCGMEAAESIELLTDRLAKSFAEGDFIRCFQTLQEDPIRDVLQTIAKMKTGNEWLITGPFSSSSDTDLLKPYPPEKDVLDGKELRDVEYTGPEGMKVQWVTNWTTEAQGSPGYLDLCSAVGPFDNAIAYAYTEVYSKLNQKVHLLIGSDDSVAAWVNGKQVHLKPGSRAAKPAEDVVQADLIAGWNKVLLKIRNGGSSWGFFFTIADENGNPIKDIQYGRDLLARKKEEAK